MVSPGLCEFNKNNENECEQFLHAMNPQCHCDPDSNLSSDSF